MGVNFLSPISWAWSRLIVEEMGVVFGSCTSGLGWLFSVDSGGGLEEVGWRWEYGLLEKVGGEGGGVRLGTFGLEADVMFKENE